MIPSIRLAALRACRRLVLVGALMNLAAFACGSVAGAQDTDVRVMTQNMYLGTNFTEIQHATSPAAFVEAVTTTFRHIQATKWEERAAAVADEIARNRPDLVALQEVGILRTRTGDPKIPATHVVADQLQLLLTELTRRREHY